MALASGAIFAVPSAGLPDGFSLRSLPPHIVRPTLQHGVFLSTSESSQLAFIEFFRFRFYHRVAPIWNGLTDIRFGNRVGLDEYLFPASDPFADIAHHVASLSIVSHDTLMARNFYRSDAGRLLSDIAAKGISIDENFRVHVDFNIIVPLVRDDLEGALEVARSAAIYIQIERQQEAPQQHKLYMFDAVLGAVLFAYHLARHRLNAEVGPEPPEEVKIIFANFPEAKDAYVRAFDSFARANLGDTT